MTSSNPTPATKTNRAPALDSDEQSRLAQGALLTLVMSFSFREGVDDEADVRGGVGGFVIERYPLDNLCCLLMTSLVRHVHLVAVGDGSTDSDAARRVVEYKQSHAAEAEEATCALARFLVEYLAVRPSPFDVEAWDLHHWRRLQLNTSEMVAAAVPDAEDDGHRKDLLLRAAADIIDLCLGFRSDDRRVANRLIGQEFLRLSLPLPHAPWLGGTDDLEDDHPQEAW